MSSLTSSVVAVVGLAAGLAFAAPPAQAAVALVPYAAGPGDIFQVEGGCGPRGHRDRFGYCRPNNRPAYRSAYRACPPGFHPTPYGCRRNY